MDNTMYVGLSGQLLLQRELDIVANNLANADTTGFKVEQLLSSVDPQTPARSTGVTPPINFVADNGVARDYSQGAMRQTGSPLDVAINGQGFFQVSTAAGTVYTRDGRFATNAQNQLVTQTGDPVLDASGSPITLNPQGGAPQIAQDGTISQQVPGQSQAQNIGRLGVVSFADLSSLTKQGDSNYTNTTNAQPTPVTGDVLRQGMLETSNVQPIVEVTDLIRISRAYDMVSNLMTETASLSTTAIQRLGSVQ
jgi:flagellar basal-body rod protein FlgF